MHDFFCPVNYFGEIPLRCNTAGCIAGWAVSLYRQDKTLRHTRTVLRGRDIERRGMTVLDLTKRQTDRLFYVSEWPKFFALALYKAKTPEKYAKVVGQRIGHFIKNKGRR